MVDAILGPASGGKSFALDVTLVRPSEHAEEALLVLERDAPREVAPGGRARALTMSLPAVIVAHRKRSRNA